MCSSILTPGQKLKAGDPLTDLLQILELNRGNTLDPAQVSALTLGPGVLSWGFYSDLTFNNQETPVQVTLDVDGYTKVSWALGGFKYDVDKFWRDVHRAGVAAGKTIAMLLDRRENPEGQPQAGNLPQTINPLTFLVQNFLRNNAYIVKVKAGNQLANRLAFVPADQLRKIQPPHTLMLLIVELVGMEFPVIMESPGTTLTPGYTESSAGFACMPFSETLSPSTFLAERVRSSQIGGRCV